VIMDISNRIKQALAAALVECGISGIPVELEHPADLAHGDYATNVALVLGRKEKKNPKELAEEIVRYIEHHKPEGVERVEVAGSGFINFYLSRDFFVGSIREVLANQDTWGKNDKLSGKKVMVEYTDPNPFKEFHIGHLMSNAIGESISRLVEFSGAEVRRANYQGDVGLHVATAVWGIQKLGASESTIDAAVLGKAYAYGVENYEVNKSEVDVVNQKLYNRSDEVLNKLYDEGKKISLEGFEDIYKILGTHFDHSFFESEVAPIGKKLVEQHTEVFEESEGATVFRAEKYDKTLHTRVFLTSQGLPTYEAKELGLAKQKFDTWEHDFSIVVTASEIIDYYRVAMKALAQIEPKLAEKVMHVPHGMMRLPSGKMSSRTGEVVTAELLIDEVKQLARKKMSDADIGDKEAVAEVIAVSAIKYSILKQAIGRDIVFDLEKALSFEGDSGPYLQYAHTRARSILKKAQGAGVVGSTKGEVSAFSELERLLYRFPEVVKRACVEYAPHYVSTYLTELAGVFNSLYAKEQVLDGSSLAPYKVARTEAFAVTMQNGLWLLGMKAPERM